MEYGFEKAESTAKFKANVDDESCDEHAVEMGPI